MLGILAIFPVGYRNHWNIIPDFTAEEFYAEADFTVHGRIFGVQILPLVDVSFGVAAGAFSQEKKNNGAGGMGGKINPSAVLVIQNGVTKLVNIKNQDGMTKILDMVPDFINKFTSGKDTDDIIDDVVSDDTDNE